MPVAGGDWVLPRRFERDEGPAWTAVGVLGAAAPAHVDSGGSIHPLGSSWSLDWWVGADDRWHLPSREAAVRQRAVEATPVVETALRVPSGDVVATAYGVIDGEQEVAVVEWANRSPVPVALALSVRPFTPRGVGHIEAIDLDHTVVLVDGDPSVVLPRTPNRAAASTADAGDVARVVLSGAAASGWRGPVRCGRGRASAAFVLPLPHGTSVRALLPLGPSETWVAGVREGGAADRPVPSPEQVVRGWIRQDEQGARFEVPDARVMATARAARCALLLGAPAASGGVGADASRAAAWAAVALALHGFPVEAAELALGIDLDQDDGTGLWALEQLLSCAPDPVLADALAVRVAGAVERLGRRRPVSATAVRGIASSATLFDLAGEDRAARDAERSVTRLLADGVEADEDPLAVLTGSAPGAGQVLGAAQVASATGAWSWNGDGQSLEVASRFLVRLRELLVREGDDGIDLCVDLPRAWMGAGLEVHDAPTRFGTAGFAVRWHGSRPALLWDVEVRRGIEPPALRSPGLDRSWVDTRPVGEALLSPSEPAPDRDVPPAAEAPDPGSFT